MGFKSLSCKWFLRGFTVLLVAALGAFVFITPNAVKAGAAEGLRLCAAVVVPSLFPFSVVAYFICMSGVLRYGQRCLGQVTGVLLGLSWSEFGVFLMSTISGYPIGARLVAEMYGRGEISRERARQMLLFCVNGGPSFIIIAVGSGMLGYKNAGAMLFLSHIAAAVIMCRIITLKRVKAAGGRKNASTESLSDCFVKSVASAANGMFSICAFVVLFSVVCALIKLLPLNEYMADIICCFAEVTTGLAGADVSVPMVSFFLGFSGFSVIFQVMASAGEIGASFVRLILSRLAHGALSFIICKGLLYAFPLSAETVSNGIGASYNANLLSPAALAALVLMLVVFTFYVSKSVNKSQL